MRDKLSFIASMIVFGAVGVFAKYINLSSSEISLCLSAIGAIVLLIFILCTKQRIQWLTIWANGLALLIASVALSGNWIFLFQAYKETTIANAALSYYVAPILVILLSPLVLKEKLSPKKVVCVVIALVGLYLILKNGSAETDGNSLIGIGYGLIAAAFYAVLTLTNKFIRDLDGLISTLIQLTISAILLAPIVIFSGGFHIATISIPSIVLLLVLGIVHGGLGFYLFFSSINRLQGQSIAVLSYIDPLTSLLISVVIVREDMTIQQLIGALLLLGSTWISESNRRRKPNKI